ncbi:hypothetical protein [Povalibacter sp.]|uniref:hypothetical protein n=1 Tax=Povalibacter sp. TaxID=1962978 RepID=UPI002F415EFE
MVTTDTSTAESTAAYRFVVEQKTAFVHIRGSGPHSEQALRRFLSDAAEAAAASGTDAALLELHFSGASMNFGDLYTIICERISDATRMRRIAFVDANPQHSLDRAEFVELAANNLGANVRRFQNVVDAERWLCE